MAYIPESSSVVSFQKPGSILTTGQLAGSILAVSTSAVANQSVSGAVTAPPGSVMMTAQLAGSVMAVSGSFAPAANQSVSGAITFPAGSIATVVNPAGSIMAVSAVQPAGSLMTVIQKAGSILAVSGSFTAPPNQSVSGTVQAELLSTDASVISIAYQLAGSILATSATVLPGSVSGAVTAPPGSVMTTAQLAGSILSVTVKSGSVIATNPAGSITSVTMPAGSTTAVLATQVTSPWIVAPNNSSLYSLQPAGSIMAVSATLTPPANQSVSGEVNVIQTTSPWIVAPNNSSLFSVQPAGSLLAVTVKSGSTLAFAPAGSLMATVVNAGSVTAVAPAGSVMATNQVAGSILSVTVVSGSIIANQAAGSLLTIITPAGSVQGVRTDLASVISIFQNSSIFALPVGSFITIQQANSIVGTYAEDTAHAGADKGLFVLAVRNDAITSISGTDRDYSPIAVDDVSRQIIVPFAGQQACIISYVGSTVSGSVQLIAASIVGSRSYVTDFSIGNTGSTTTLVTIQGGDTSVLGQFIVPAGGGNNKVWQIPLRTTLSQDLAFKVSPSQSILYAVIKGYQAP